MAFSFLRVKVLIWADIVAVYTIWMAMPYLTEVWKLNLTHAAAIINVFWAIFYMTLLPLLFLDETVTGNFSMLLLSALSSSCGLGLLAMSTPPALHRITGTCSEYRPDCIGHEQQVLFYIALPLIALGMSGQLISLVPFAVEQVERVALIHPQMPTTNSLVFVVAIVLLYINPWSIRFGVQAICTAAATVIFFTGICLYRRVKPQGSPLTAVFRVLTAAASKILHRLPDNDSQLFEMAGLSQIPHSRRLRWLDKAAIVEEAAPLEEQARRRWRLCRVTEIEETKSILRMLPICFTFIIFGLVSSLNSTFFVSQANTMNNKVGKLHVPIPILLWFHHNFKYQLFRNYLQIFKWISPRPFNRRAPEIGIAVAITFAVFCCMTAADVESRRLRAVELHGLVEKPGERVPMTMFWLLPQFLLMGCMEGTVWSCVNMVLFDQKNIPNEMRWYLSLFAGGSVMGSGFLGSILAVDVVGNVSGRSGKVGWFEETLNKSRLDKYYWTLAALSAVWLVVYILVAVFYCCCGDSAEGREDDDAVDIDVRCCCCYFTYSQTSTVSWIFNLI